MRVNTLKFIVILFISLSFSMISLSEDFVINVNVKLKDLCLSKVVLQCTVGENENALNNAAKVIVTHDEPIPHAGRGSFKLTKAIQFSADEGKDFRKAKGYSCTLLGKKDGSWNNFRNHKMGDEYCVHSKNSKFKVWHKSVFDVDINQNQDVHTIRGSLPTFEATGTRLPGMVKTPEFYAEGERNEK